MTSDTVINILILILYIGMMVGMGIYSIRHTKTVDGFLLGGRGLGPWLSAFAYGTSFFQLLYLSDMQERMVGILEFQQYG